MDKNEEIREFIANLVNDEKLNNEFQEILKEGSKEKAYEFALKHSKGDFSKEDFENYISLITKEYHEELEESSLSQVSGGGDSDKKGDGHLPMADAMWEKVGEGGYGKMIETIYGQEQAIADEKNKATIIGAGVDAAGNIVNLIKNFGNLYFSGQDINEQKREWEDNTEARDLKNLKLKYEIAKIKNKLDAKGINYNK